MGNKGTSTPPPPHPHPQGKKEEKRSGSREHETGVMRMKALRLGNGITGFTLPFHVGIIGQLGLVFTFSQENPFFLIPLPVS